MKKTIVIIVVVAMFGWAVYDLVIDTEDDKAGDEDFTVEEKKLQISKPRKKMARKAQQMKLVWK